MVWKKIFLFWKTKIPNQFQFGLDFLICLQRYVNLILQTFMEIHIGFNFSDSIQCAFLNVSSNYLSERMHNCTCYIYFTFLQSVFSNGPSNYLPERRHSCTSCIDMTFLRCVFSNVSLKHLHKMMQSHTGCTSISPVGVFKNQHRMRPASTFFEHLK